MGIALVSIKFILKFTVELQTESFYRAFQYLRPKLDVTKVKN